jgi:hypothetical protein
VIELNLPANGSAGRPIESDIPCSGGNAVRVMDALRRELGAEAVESDDLILDLLLMKEKEGSLSFSEQMFLRDIQESIGQQ